MEYLGQPAGQRRKLELADGIELLAHVRTTVAGNAGVGFLRNRDNTVVTVVGKERVTVPQKTFRDQPSRRLREAPWPDREARRERLIASN